MESSRLQVLKDVDVFSICFFINARYGIVFSNKSMYNKTKYQYI